MIKPKGDRPGRQAKRKRRKINNKNRWIYKSLDNLSPKASILMGLNEDELPDSKRPTYTTMNIPRGGAIAFTMTVDVLTKKGKGGSAPSVSNTPWEILKKRKDGGRTYYVRGHMLNHNLHGPGNTWDNLTILSQKGNRNHLDAAENPVKIAVDSGAIVKYHVIADYKGTRDSEVSDAELEAAGIDPSQWQMIRDIKSFEKTAVPEQLMLTADRLEPNESGRYKVQKNLVKNKKVPNPVETELNKYEVGEGKNRENVSLANDSLEKISENTDFDIDDLKPMPAGARL